MISGKFDPQQFLQQVDHVALSVAAEEVFGFLRRSFDLPPSWAALLTRETGDLVLVGPGGQIEATDIDSLMFVRVTPLDVSVIEEVTSKDGFQCRASVSIKVGVIPERSELESFQKTLLGSHRVIKVDNIVRHVQMAMKQSLIDVAAGQEAAALVEGRSTALVLQGIQDALKQPCFLAGLQLMGEPQVKWESQSHRQLQQVRQHGALVQAQQEINRKLGEARRDAQEARIEQLAETLSRIHHIAAKSPDTALPELLRAFSQQQRGDIYEAVFATQTHEARTRWIAVAAGQEILFFDPHATDTAPRRVSIAGEAGAVRSIQVMDNNSGVSLLLGAATGVYRLPVDAIEPDATWLVPEAPAVRGGFNAVVGTDDRIIASHSELGIWSWSRQDAADAVELFSSLTSQAKAVRSVVRMASMMYCAVDAQIVSWSNRSVDGKPGEIFTGSTSTITAICPSGRGLYAGNAEGDILHWPVGVTDKPQTIHRGMQRPAESLWLTSAHSVDRLVFTDTSLAVYALVVGDSFVCRYEAGGQTLRRVDVAGDVIVATTELRDRLICWSPSDPSRPKATIAVGALCSRSIQDVCLVPECPPVSV